MLNLIDIAQKIINLPRFSKRLIVIIFDLSLCVVCTWFAFYLRLEKFISINDSNILITLISISLAIPIFWLFGLYRTIFRFGGQSLIFTVTLAVGIYGLFYFFIIGVYVIQGVPRSIGIIQPLLLFFGISSSRIIIEYLFINSFFQTNFKNKKKILIYGAGSAGRQILASLENNPEMEVVGFLDDNTQYHNQLILGQTVYDPLKIKELIILKDINLVLLAIPLINRAKRNDIIDYLNSFKITVKTLPSIQDIVDDKISFSDIKDLTVEDLLSRDEVQPNQELLSKDIYSKTVLVSGAGGSIGSELCRQIVKLKPQKLLLLELNEYALFKISEDLKKKENNIKIIPLLINVQNSSRLNVVFETFKIDTVYHAAAYKHVSLVEENICESVKNNVFGTFLITQAAIKNKVSNFVLISTDKAVRSTNVMGATKRLAEICVQSLYNYDKVKKTKFAIVRFGNVLQSSGSVIPKFRKQIMEGGPLTLTDPEVTRYFMTIKEASQLVIQAGALSESCEVFVLDMGESVKIYDLIHKMIKLSGLTVKDSKNLDGDIEIKITGLRPGEKLYEELLIGDNPRKTSHKKIQKAQDPFILFNELKIDLDILSTLLETNRVSEVKSMLNKLIPSFQSNSKIIDHIHEERSIFKNEIKKTSLTNYNRE
tara:strand:- start:277 stop:2238 length:1962 start_codon:yes stop_codon:yes gene_type:complete